LNIWISSIGSALALVLRGIFSVGKLNHWFYVALAAVSGFFGLGSIAAKMLENWLHNEGYLEHPETAFTKFASFIGAFTRSEAFWPTSAAMISISAGYPTGVLVDAWIADRHNKLAKLGPEMLKMAAMIRQRQGGFRNPWPDNIGDGRGHLEALFSRSQEASLKTPRDSVFGSADGLNALLEYLEIVGAHLTQGNYKIATKRATELV
jgi:hypothetical protein